MNTAITSEELRSLIKQSQLLQSEIAEGVGLSQGQISRLIAGRFKRPGKAYNDLCIYVLNNMPKVQHGNVGANTEIMEAIASVWDGSPEQASAIAKVIRSLGSLCKKGAIDAHT